MNHLRKSIKFAMMDLERASIATDEQPEFNPGDRVYFPQGHKPTPNAILSGTVIQPTKNWKSTISQQFVLIQPDKIYRENGWPNEVLRKKSEIKHI